MYLNQYKYIYIYLEKIFIFFTKIIKKQLQNNPPFYQPHIRNSNQVQYGCYIPIKKTDREPWRQFLILLVTKIYIKIKSKF